MMNIKNFSALFLVFILFSCVEKYDFNVKNENKGLVIEASISNISFVRSLTFPSDGRYFQVQLSETSDVNNIQNKKVSGATVKLENKSGESWIYIEDPMKPGFYYLRDELFAAQKEQEYRLTVKLMGGQFFHSNWEIMPAGENELGDLKVEETNPELYVFQGGERVIRNVDGIDLYTTGVADSREDHTYYKWTFEPLWIFKAALVLENSNPKQTCWVTADYYLNDYVLADYRRGETKQKLCFIETIGNDKVYHYFSTLVRQERISKGYHQFWEEIEFQKDKGGLYDQPPFGLITNFTSDDPEWTVNGYFGVVSESTKRWTFNPRELSYAIENNLYDYCMGFDPMDPTDQCHDCRSYNIGLPLNYPPNWWDVKLQQ